MGFTLYTANCTGLETNYLYPNRVCVSDAASLREAVRHDYVCAEYAGAHRSASNFVLSDCVAMDCDNDGTEDPDEWITPEKLAEKLPDLTFAVHYSRNNLKPKNGRAARPKFHVFFPISPVKDAKEYAAIKQRLHKLCPFFDGNALDAARFFYGTEEGKAEYFAGIYDDLKGFFSLLDDETPFDDDMPLTHGVIAEGSRNKTLHNFALRVLKRYGDKDGHARELFDEKAAMCDPPLPDKELETIWRQSLKYYAGAIKLQDGYVEPEQFVQGNYVPDDLSEVGEAECLAAKCRDTLRYNKGIGMLRYDGIKWEESMPFAHKLVQDLTRAQLAEAKALHDTAENSLRATGAEGILATHTLKKALTLFDEQQMNAYSKFQQAEHYLKFVQSMRTSTAISHVLTEVQPSVHIEIDELDHEKTLLNTPEGAYDLMTGERREHRGEDYCTKVTKVEPNRDNIGLWTDTMERLFKSDAELIGYVQKVVGMSLVGQVNDEKLIIAYGNGRNGKSTMWSAIAEVLGDYSGSISADTLTKNCKRNVKPEMASMEGKRLLLASEMDDEAEISSGTVKQICSTDRILGERKYHDPHTFIPSHTVVLSTNSLPKVTALNDGTWRRFEIIPYKAKIEGKSDIKNYGRYLVEHAGGAILQWCIDGAVRYMTEGLGKRPSCVEQAISDYREENDWLGAFIADKCDVDPDYSVPCSDLYSSYHDYSVTNGWTTKRSVTDLVAELQKRGYEKKRTSKSRLIVGLKLKEEATLDE